MFFWLLNVPNSAIATTATASSLKGCQGCQIIDFHEKAEPNRVPTPNAVIHSLYKSMTYVSTLHNNDYTHMRNQHKYT